MISTDFWTTGEGIVFSYDAVGCFEKMKYTVSGTGQALIEPFLDNMVAYKNTDKKPLSERCAEASLSSFIVAYCTGFRCQGIFLALCTDRNTAFSRIYYGLLDTRLQAGTRPAEMP